MTKVSRDGSAGEWIVREVVVANPKGLHIRPATALAKIALDFEACEITVEKDGLRVSAKSVMGLLNLGAEGGSRLRITAQGPGAKDVIDRIEDVVKVLHDD